MSFLDKIIAEISPQRGLIRKRARLALGELRQYEASQYNRRTQGWLATGSSANAEIAAGGATLRNRARDLVRNNPYATAAANKLAAKMVGAGIVPRLKKGQLKYRKEVMEDWEEFCRTCDMSGNTSFYGLQKQVARAVPESGEVLLRWKYAKSTLGLRIPLQVQLLEPDYIDTWRNETLADGLIVQGIEYDNDGRRRAYYLFEDHPGEIIPMRASRGIQSVRVDAKDIDHVFRVDRPGQQRGITWFASVAMLLRDVGDFNDAELLRNKLAACLGIMITRANGRATPVAPTEKQADGRNVETLSPGMVLYGNQGDDVKVISPPAHDGYADYIRVQLRAIAAGIGMTYEQLTGDLSGVNYSSIRAGLIDFWDLLDGWQWDMLVPQLCAKAWRRFQEARLIKGYNGADLQADWATPVRAWVDPYKDALAEVLLIRAGLKSQYEAIAARGEDPATVLQEIADCNAEIDRLKLILDTDPRRVTGAGVGQFVDPDPSDIGPNQKPDGTNPQTKNKRKRKK